MESRREAMIAAAAELLDRGGPAAVTLRQVGKAAGVSHNAPYKHFADKQELLAAVAARELDQLSKSISRGGTGVRSARGMAHGYVRRAVRYPERFKLVFGRWDREDPELREAASRSYGLLLTVVAEAQAAGELPAGDTERLASLIRALAHGAADLALSGHLKAGGKGAADPQDLVDDIFNYLARAGRSSA